MHYSLITSLALAGTTLAQSSSTSPQPGSTTHVVLVGDENGTPKFAPSVVSASVGHNVEFWFLGANHSVAEGAFDSPCKPLEQSASAKGKTGFFSGFQPVENGTDANGQKTANNAGSVGLKTFTVKVASADPVWFYDAQDKNCQAGMVGVINPKNSTGQTFEAFQAAAKQAPSNIAPAKIAGGTEWNQALKAKVVKGVAKPSGAAASASPGVAKASSGAAAKVQAGVSTTISAPLCTGTPTGNSSTVLAADFSGTVAPPNNVAAATTATAAGASSAAAGAASGPSTMAGGAVIMPSGAAAAATAASGSAGSASSAAVGAGAAASSSSSSSSGSAAGAGIVLPASNSTSSNSSGIVTGGAASGPQTIFSGACSLSVLVMMAGSFALFA